MKKINKNVLIIGGLGHWSNKTYLPALSKKYFCGNLYVCDIKTCENNPNYYKLPNTNKERVEKIRQIIDEKKIDIVIVSTPPENHYDYLSGLIDLKINIICDKPLVSDINYQNILPKYLELLKKKKSNIYSPLRRQVQKFYTTAYSEIKIIKERFNQNVKLVCYYENDGVHRWDDEMEINFAHGYSSGLGKLSHTGYHILDVVARIISDGCENIKSLECEIVDEHTVKNNKYSKTNMNLQKLLGAQTASVNLREATNDAELDITVKYTINFYDDMPSYVYLFLRHSGVSHRETLHYDDFNTGDDGRTDNSMFIVEQGAFQNIFASVFADSSSRGSKGKSYLTIKRHRVVARCLKSNQNRVLKIKNIKDTSNVQIVRNLICAFYDKKLQEQYAPVEFSNQVLTMELYVASLLAKKQGKKIEWEIGKLNDSLH